VLSEVCKSSLSVTNIIYKQYCGIKLSFISFLFECI
jgi:hypothetical protein